MKLGATLIGGLVGAIPSAIYAGITFAIKNPGMSFQTLIGAILLVAVFGAVIGMIVFNFLEFPYVAKAFFTGALTPILYNVVTSALSEQPLFQAAWILDFFIVGFLAAAFGYWLKRQLDIKMK